MKTLANILFEQTTLLRDEFYTKTKKWATATHARIMERVTWKEKQWCEYLGITPELKSGCGKSWEGFPTGFYNTKQSREYRKLYQEVLKMKAIPLEKHVDNELKKAERHYNASIEKLALRIAEKGLNMEKLKVETGRVGINIETTLTDGSKTVRAFTVLAWGPIKAPHYRYLIK